MRICYVDESGDTRDLPAGSPGANVPPVLVVGGVVVDQRLLENLTRSFIELKTRFYPEVVQGATRLGRILPEIKGADIRRAMRTGAPRRNQRHSIGFLNNFMELLGYHDARIFGRIWVKPIGGTCDGRSMYTFSVQEICAHFENLLEAEGDVGFVVADSRNPGPNAWGAHSIFTQKFKSNGDRYPRVLEMPLFGHSKNHAGLQIADVLCSALLFPMATCCYCSNHLTSNRHVDPGFGQLVARYGVALGALQHRYRDDLGKRRGGFTVSDPVGRQGGGILFSGGQGAP